ncbi:MAG: prolyl oligopeptidase family serine peptidase, partial [Erysipelotrichaceae bacterium]|nr:prolyl oligopeptidase family serine peptidase [Erysipelotrichaceae bacterium]
LNNVMSVMRFVRSLDFVTEMYVAGHSQGGLTALLAAGMYPDVFSAALLLSPASMVPGLAREGSLFKVSFDPCAIPDELYVSDTEKVTGDYVRAAQLIDIEDAVKRYKKPVLIVHGDEDEAIPYTYSEKLADMYSNAKLVIINGDDHCYNSHLEEVTGAIRDFLSMLRDQDPHRCF